MRVVRTVVWTAVVVALVAYGPDASAACQTNETTSIDLTTWTPIQYGPFGQPPANWVVTASNEVVQMVNADGSIFLSPFALANDNIQGTWRVDTDQDDDFMGFVFGFQDTSHFYLFDWKQVDQVHPSGAISAAGMTVKAIHADSPLVVADFYETFPLNTNRVRTLYHNNMPWAEFTDYGFQLQFFPGHFIITVSQGPTVLVTITIADNTYTNGQFGFYNFSQGMVRYRSFTRQSLDLPPLVSVLDQSVVEGNSGSTNLVFSITLSKTNCQATQLEYLISPGSANPRVDYTDSGRGTLIFAPGETNKTVTVTVHGDLLHEPNETLFITLTNPVSALLGVSTATGTILNDDEEGNTPPTVAIVSPADGSSFPAPPGLVQIAAEATDTGGLVERVDFYADGEPLGTDATGPYALLWTNNTIGTYLLTAIATDNAGARATSALVRISIRTCNTALEATALTNQTLCAFDQGMFGTTVTSEEPVTFVWRLNEMVIPGETNSALVLRSLKAEDVGTYTVEILSPCAAISRSATLTVKGAGNPVSFTNSSRITIIDNTVASPYPSPITVECVPGVIRHLSVTLHGLSHNYPDDADILLVSPAGASLKLLSDVGGTSANKLTNVVLTFSDTATLSLPDATRILPDLYAPTDYPPLETFPPPAPAVITATNFQPFIGTNPNGTWSLFIRDDTGGDAGSIGGGWSLTIESEIEQPRLANPSLRPDGRFQMSLEDRREETYVIEASSDLRTWVPIATVPPGSSGVLVFQMDPQDDIYRFYRAVCCP
jgi:subtilisin-like proprotein convertase family protein